MVHCSSRAWDGLRGNQLVPGHCRRPSAKLAPAGCTEPDPHAVPPSLPAWQALVLAVVLGCLWLRSSWATRLVALLVSRSRRLQVWWKQAWSVQA